MSRLVYEIEPGDQVSLLGQVEDGARAADAAASRQIASREMPAIEGSGQDLLWEGHSSDALSPPDPNVH